MQYFRVEANGEKHGETIGPSRSSSLDIWDPQAEDQWDIFARKQGMEPRELYNSYTLGELHEWLRQAELEQAISAWQWQAFAKWESVNCKCM